MNHQSAEHRPHRNLPNSSLSCDRTTLLPALYTRQPFMRGFMSCWVTQKVSIVYIETKWTRPSVCIFFAFIPHLLHWFVPVRILYCVLSLPETMRGYSYKNANQQCFSQLSRENRRPLFPKKIILKTHGNTDVAYLTFDISDCHVLVVVFLVMCFLFGSIFRLSQTKCNCSQPWSEPSRESPSPS